MRSAPAAEPASASDPESRCGASGPGLGASSKSATRRAIGPRRRARAAVFQVALHRDRPLAGRKLVSSGSVAAWQAAHARAALTGSAQSRFKFLDWKFGISGLPVSLSTKMDSELKGAGSCDHALNLNLDFQASGEAVPKLVWDSSSYTGPVYKSSASIRSRQLKPLKSSPEEDSRRPWNAGTIGRGRRVSGRIGRFADRRFFGAAIEPKR